MGFSDILDATFSLYREHFRLFFRIVAVYCVSEVGIDLLNPFLLEASTAPGAHFLVKVAHFLVEGLGFLEYFLACFIEAALIVASLDIYFRRQITCRAALRRVLQRFRSCCCEWIVTFIPLVVFVACLLKFFELLDDPRMTEGVSLALIFAPFAIYFLVRWLFVEMVILFEGSTANKAFGRSAELVKGTEWRVFGIATALYAIALMVAVILLGVCLAPLVWTGVIEPPAIEDIISLFSEDPSELGWGVYIILRFILRGVAISTILPLFAIGTTLLYFNMRIRKEGFDLQMQTQQQETPLL